MKPPPRTKTNFEKVAIGEILPGIIEQVEYDMEHKFKGFQGKEDTIQPAVRLRFKLDGYQYQHYTRWMKFSLGGKANLYLKYVSKLVEGAAPDMEFDLDILNGMRIKTVWSENKDFQNVDAIYPQGPKVKTTDPVVTSTKEEPFPEEEPPIEEEPPF